MPIYGLIVPVLRSISGVAHGHIFVPALVLQRLHFTGFNQTTMVEDSGQSMDKALRLFSKIFAEALQELRPTMVIPGI